MKVGIVGLGFRLGYLGRFSAAAHPDFEVVGYVDPGAGGLAAPADANVSPGKQYDTLEALLDNEELDLLMVGSPNTHASRPHPRRARARAEDLHRKAGRHHRSRDDGTGAARSANTAPTV